MVFDSLEAAREAAEAADMTVMLVYKGDKPVYTLVPLDATDGEYRAAAFEAKYDRPMDDTEELLLKLAGAIV